MYRIEVTNKSFRVLQFSKLVKGKYFNKYKDFEINERTTESKIGNKLTINVEIEIILILI